MLVDINEEQYNYSVNKHERLIVNNSTEERQQQ